MKQNTKSVGEKSEAIILSVLLRLNLSVSIPFGNNQRYDLILDDNGKLFKVQCKTARLIQGCISFAVASKNGFTNMRKSYHGEVDLFLVYCPEMDAIYKVPVEITPTNEMRLRITELKPKAPKNNVKWAKDYQLHFKEL